MTTPTIARRSLVSLLKACSEATGTVRYGIDWLDGETETVETATEAAKACDAVEACRVYLLADSGKHRGWLLIVNEAGADLADRIADYSDRDDLRAVLGSLD